MENITFLNVDLDLKSNEDLTLVLEELGDNVVVMNNVKESLNKVSLELAGIVNTPEELILEYLRLLEKLSTKAKSILNSCTKKQFDIGFECEGEPINKTVSITEELSFNTLSLLAKLEISLAITIYSVASDIEEA